MPKGRLSLSMLPGFCRNSKTQRSVLVQYTISYYPGIDDEELKAEQQFGSEGLTYAIMVCNVILKDKSESQNTIYNISTPATMIRHKIRVGYQKNKICPKEKPGGLKWKVD